jgi:hypothetical protein
MRRFLVLLLFAFAVFADEPHPILPIGSPAPDFALPGIDGKIHRLSDYSASKILVIRFYVQSLSNGATLRESDQKVSRGLSR